jgi:uracil-DNA glycosylase
MAKETFQKMTFHIEPSWDLALEGEFEKPYFKSLRQFVANQRAGHAKVFPPEHLVFHAFKATPYDKVKVVILGQDPYHGEGQANGLAFSVPLGVKTPPSLRNIFKELHSDLKVPVPSQGSLEKWARQGVLLLNATLTVNEAKPLSHHDHGWEEFTDAAIRALAKRKKPVVFLLWGSQAQEKCARVPELMANSQHAILIAAHPSPFSAYRGFFGCKHFSKTNEILTGWHETPIDWSLS